MKTKNANLKQFKHWLQCWEEDINNANNRKEAFISFMNRFKRDYAPELLNYYFEEGQAIREYYISGQVVQIKRNIKSEVNIKLFEF